MKKIHTYFIALLFISTAVSGYARQPYATDIITGQTISREGDMVRITMQVDPSRAELGSTHMLTLNPSIISSDGTDSEKLPSMVITGRNKAKSLKRSIRLGSQTATGIEPYRITSKNKDREITYETTVAYKGWMQGGRVIVDEQLTGCASMQMASPARYTVASSIFKADMPAPAASAYILPELTPKAEAVKERGEVSEITLAFKVNNSQVLPGFANNAAVLAKFDSLYGNMRNNPDINITEIRLTGYASPEGGAEANMALSERRARSLAEYLRNLYALDRNNLKLSWKGADWDGLARAVESSGIPYRQIVLDILDSDMKQSDKLPKIRQLADGQAYSYMRDNLFPPLRRNICVIEYTAASCDIDKAKELIQTNPKLLSVGEIYMVAESYGKGTAAYNELIEKAAVTFPDDPVAAVNSVTGELSRGETHKALSRLEPLSDKPEVWNTLGVAYAISGRYDQAANLLKKAADNGSPAAAANYKTLTDFIGQQ